jgi:RimJ/RimL family protein N-acetyltransferase
MIDIRIRNVEDSDYAVFFELRSDTVAARMAAFGARDPDAASFAARWKKAGDAGGADPKAITIGDRESGGEEVVGFVATFLLEGKLQIAYWIARPHWGRGIASAALAQLLRQVTTRPLYASAAKDNLGSLRVLEKCGFKIFGSGRAFAEARGDEIEEVFMELT